MAHLLDGKTVGTVLVLIAMKQEAEPFIKLHGLTPVESPPWSPKLPMVAYSGVIGTIRTYVVWAGRCERFKVNNVATTASTLSAYVSIMAFQPDLVISAGTAGGFASAGGRIGDVYLTTKCVFHSRRIPSGKQYEEYGFGHFRSPDLSSLAIAADLKQGVCTTSDSLDATPRDLQLMRSEGAALKDMEAAAVAWVCQQLDVPFVGLKSVTDIVDGKHATQDEFYANLATASQRLQEKLTGVLTLLGGSANSSSSSNHSQRAEQATDTSAATTSSSEDSSSSEETKESTTSTTVNTSEHVEVIDMDKDSRTVAAGEEQTEQGVSKLHVAVGVAILGAVAVLLNRRART